MEWSKTCVVIIPCYNEAGSIAGVVAHVRAYVSTVYVVDDGSLDTTAGQAREAGAQVFSHTSNLGKGVALRTGCQRALQNGFLWALLMDGDGQHAPGNIPAFFARAQETNAGLIVGNRMGQEDSMPRLRRFVNRWMSRRLSALAGREVPDSQCGFRLIRLDTWSRLELKTTRFEVESEMLIAFLDAECSVEFVPVDVLYKRCSSKIHPIIDSWRWWVWWRQACKRSRTKRP